MWWIPDSRYCGISDSLKVELYSGILDGHPGIPVFQSQGFRIAQAIFFPILEFEHRATLFGAINIFS